MSHLYKNRKKISEKNCRYLFACRTPKAGTLQWRKGPILINCAVGSMEEALLRNWEEHSKIKKSPLGTYPCIHEPATVSRYFTSPPPPLSTTFSSRAYLPGQNFKDDFRMGLLISEFLLGIVPMKYLSWLAAWRSLVGTIPRLLL